MENAHSAFISVEARSLATLRLKIAARQAAGWITDGPMVEVTDYARSGRKTNKYSQSMFRPEPLRVPWMLLR
jgi:hypothetical protein